VDSWFVATAARDAAAGQIWTAGAFLGLLVAVMPECWRRRVLYAVTLFMGGVWCLSQLT